MHRLALLSACLASLSLFAGVRMFFGPHSNAPYPGNKLLKGIW